MPSELDLSGAATATTPTALSPDQTIKNWVLGHISSGEATRYNELYGGGSFQGYAQHPNVRMELPSGSYTTAAGKFQFLFPTWRSEANKLGLPDFSPKSQDAAAWDLANTTYQKTTGRSLMDDAKAGKVDWSALASQWPSLGGGAKAENALGLPKQTGEAEPGTSGVATGTAQPSAGGMPPYLRLMLLQAAMPHVTLQPVDYDPFKVEPKVG